MVSQVTKLTTLKGFGFSLDGKVDVDDNGYRVDNKQAVNHVNVESLSITFSDLVISAVSNNNTGQAVFVLRYHMNAYKQLYMRIHRAIMCTASQV